MTRGTIVASVAALIVAAAVMGGLVVAGPPAAERERRLDARRVDDLSAISRAVDLYVARQQAMPAAVADLATPSAPPLDVTDPSTRRPYEYRVTGANRYEVCATFSRASEPRAYSDFWAHRRGRQCFPLNVRDVSR